MGRFDLLDGLIMLALQLGWVRVGLRVGAMALRQASPPLGSSLLAGLLSFVLAFAVHILVLNLLKGAGPAVYDNLWLRRSIVALSWACASWLALWLVLRPRPQPAIQIAGALGGALAYLIFALWRA